ncbi:MAG: glycosyltransferase family 4 protein [Nitrospirae bacterium]|nr:glycosyltransferase family 4 protein [Nitrospirota bacterium]
MDRSEKPKSETTIHAREVAMLCKGDDGYGVAAVLKQYAQNVPEFHFVCLGPGAMYDWLKQNGNHVHLVEGLAGFTATSSIQTLSRFPRAMFLARRDALRLHRLLQSLGVRIIHAHWLPQHMIAGHMRRLGYSSVWHIHGNMTSSRLFGYGVKLNHSLARWGADLLIPVSDFIASNWRGAGVPIHTIHNAANVIFDGPNDLELNPIRCVIAGRLIEDKGHHLAVQAVLSARAAGHDVQLDVFGGPLDNNSYFDRLRTLAEQSRPQECIRFMGFSKDLRLLHQSYALGLQCRISPEPCSVWVCETLLDGLPLIASDSGGTSELVEEGITGFMFRSGDVEDLTSKLIKMAADLSGLKAMRRHAYARGQKHFRLNRFLAQTFEAYETLRASPTVGTIMRIGNHKESLHQ